MDVTKKLAVPLWILVGIALMILCILLVGEIRTTLLYSKLPKMLSKEMEQREPEETMNFAKWPIERQVGMSTLILRTEWKLENGTYKCIIAEVIKGAGSSDGPYRIGEEYSTDNTPAREGLDVGEGEVLFFTGSPPNWQYSSVIRAGKVVGMRGITIDTLRNMVNKPPAKSN
jgi:hypothetical protein